jgi:transposase
MAGKTYTDEFKRDVVAVAKQGGVTRRQIAKDFGISKSALSAWMHAAEVRDRGFATAGPGGAGSDQVLREALKRVRLLEQEAEVMRAAVAYLSQAVLPK